MRIMILFLVLLAPFAHASDRITCPTIRILDGDTFDCGHTRIRLQGIDTPEMPHHCRAGRVCTPGDPYAARNYLGWLLRDPVACDIVTTDRYGRKVARCQTAKTDLSCAMIESGHAVKRYGPISCP